jgi:hypothetical protein
MLHGAEIRLNGISCRRRIQAENTVYIRSRSTYFGEQTRTNFDAFTERGHTWQMVYLQPGTIMANSASHGFQHVQPEF